MNTPLEPRRSTGGFSLIEMILVMGFLAMVSTAAFVVFPQVRSSRVANEVLAELTRAQQDLMAGVPAADVQERLAHLSRNTGFPLQWSVRDISARTWRAEVGLPRDFQRDVCLHVGAALADSTHGPSTTLNGKPLPDMHALMDMCAQEGPVRFAVFGGRTPSDLAPPAGASIANLSAKGSAASSVDTFENNEQARRAGWEGANGF